MIKASVTFHPTDIPYLKRLPSKMSGTGPTIRPPILSPAERASIVKLYPLCVKLAETDLNSITPVTSPADFFQKQHLTGSEYADCLRTGVAHFRLNVQEQEKVSQITPEGDGYCIQTVKDTYRTSTPCV